MVFVLFWPASVCIVMFYSNCLCIAGWGTENQKYDNIKLENSRDREAGEIYSSAEDISPAMVTI